MKPNTTSKIEHRLARHERRAQSKSAFPATNHLFRPEPGTATGRAWRRPSDRSGRAFRRMTREMLAKYERDEPLELALFVFVTAIAAWPLVLLIIALAQPASG